MLLHGFDFSRSERNVVGYGNPKKKKKKSKKYIFSFRYGIARTFLFGFSFEIWFWWLVRFGLANEQWWYGWGLWRHVVGFLSVSMAIGAVWLGFWVSPWVSSGVRTMLSGSCVSTQYRDGWRFFLGEFLEFFCSCWVLFNCCNCFSFWVYVFVKLMLFMSFHGVLGVEIGRCGVFIGIGYVMLCFYESFLVNCDWLGVWVVTVLCWEFLVVEVKKVWKKKKQMVMTEVVRLVGLKEMGEWGKQRWIEMIMVRKVCVWCEGRGEGIFGICKIIVVVCWFVSRVAHVSNISV